MARRNLLRSWLAAALSLAAVAAAGLLTAQPAPVGAAERRGFQIQVSDAGFNPPIQQDVNVGDVLMFVLNQTTDQHTITFEDGSLCPGSRGAVPCWPELRFDDGNPNCVLGDTRLPGRRCMIVQEPGKTVQYHDAFNPANIGEIRVLGQPTTTTGPTTTTTTAPTSTTSTTAPPTTISTWVQSTTTTTAPQPIRPFVMPGPSPTSTTAPPAVVVVTNTVDTAAPAAKQDKDKEKDKDKDKAKSKAAGTETPTTASPTPPDAMPPDSVFDPAALTPGPVQVPDTSGDGDAEDEVNLESAAVMNLLDRDEPASHIPMLLALGGLALLLCVGGLWCWFHRASRYDPA